MLNLMKMSYTNRIKVANPSREMFCIIASSPLSIRMTISFFL